MNIDIESLKYSIGIPNELVLLLESDFKSSILNTYFVMCSFSNKNNLYNSTTIEMLLNNIHNKECGSNSKRYQKRHIDGLKNDLTKLIELKYFELYNNDNELINVDDINDFKLKNIFYYKLILEVNYGFTLIYGKEYYKIKTFESINEVNDIGEYTYSQKIKLFNYYVYLKKHMNSSRRIQINTCYPKTTYIIDRLEISKNSITLYNQMLSDIGVLYYRRVDNMVKLVRGKEKHLYGENIYIATCFDNHIKQVSDKIKVLITKRKKEGYTLNKDYKNIEQSIKSITAKINANKRWSKNIDDLVAELDRLLMLKEANEIN